MSAPASISYRHILNRAWPIVLANMAVPLLGLADTAVIGNFGRLEDLGAIAFGALIFSFIYWGFSFLRTGTTAFAAQAAGAGDEPEIRAVLGRALLTGAAGGLGLIALQLPVGALAFALLDGGEAVEAAARGYYAVRIWGAPATLTVFALMGVLVGLGDSRRLLAAQLFLNGLNAALDVVFAGLLGMGAIGVALGTVLAEWSTVGVAGALVWRRLDRRRTAGEPFWPPGRIADRAALRRVMAANRDIMLRTLTLAFSFAFFTNQAASFGDAVLAASHILLQFVSFAAFFLDGYALAAESLVGSAVGAGRRDRFDMTVLKSTVPALVTALALAGGIWAAGPAAVALLTDHEEVRGAAGPLLHLAAVYVALSFGAFQLDGIFIGAARTRQMRDAAFLSCGAFLAVWRLAAAPFGIVGLWWAMIAYVAARAVALMLYFPGLRRSIPARSGSRAGQ